MADYTFAALAPTHNVGAFSCGDQEIDDYLHNRAAAEQAGLQHALVFVHADRWGWKSAFPLNDYPLEQNDVLYARDFGTRNGELQRLFPDRAAYLARIGADGRAYLRRLAGD